MEGDVEKCLICDRTLDRNGPLKISTCKTVAIASLKSASLKRKDNKFLKWKNLTSVDLHKSCYNKYIKDKNIEIAKERWYAAVQVQRASKGLRSTVKKSETQDDSQAHQNTELETEIENDVGVHFMVQSYEEETKKPSNFTLQNRCKSSDSVIELAQNFDLKTHCFFCAGSADDAYIKSNTRLPISQRSKKRVRFVSKDKTKDNILKFIKEHSENYYLQAVKDRIENVNLINCRYHESCMKHFYSLKDSSNKIIGHPMSEAT